MSENRQSWPYQKKTGGVKEQGELVVSAKADRVREQRELTVSQNRELTVSGKGWPYRRRLAQIESSSRRCLTVHTPIYLDRVGEDWPYQRVERVGRAKRAGRVSRSRRCQQRPAGSAIGGVSNGRCQ